MGTVVRIDPWFVREWERIRRKVDSIKGDGASLEVTNGPDFILFKVNPARRNPAPLTPIETIVRYKIKTAPDTSGVAICNTWDGTTAGTVDVPVKVWTVRAVGQVLYASQPVGGTGKTYSGSAVTWREMAADYQPFEVTLESDGGVSGTNQSANCSYTYTVKDVTAAFTLGTGVALTGKGNGWRGLLLQLTPGTRGRAFLLDTGAVMLTHADEYPSDEQDCQT